MSRHARPRERWAPWVCRHSCVFLTACSELGQIEVDAALPGARAKTVSPGLVSTGCDHWSPRPANGPTPPSLADPAHNEHLADA
jgi:hypothetical protein